jgi:hypothetical protein
VLDTKLIFAADEYRIAGKIVVASRSDQITPINTSSTINYSHLHLGSYAPDLSVTFSSIYDHKR